MQHAKFKDHRIWVLEKKCLKCFTLYRHGGRLGHVTKIIFYKFLCPFFPRRLSQNFALIGKTISENKRFENNGHIHVNSPWGQG